MVEKLTQAYEVLSPAEQLEFANLNLKIGKILSEKGGDGYLDYPFYTAAIYGFSRFLPENENNLAFLRQLFREVAEKWDGTKLQYQADRYKEQAELLSRCSPPKGEPLYLVITGPSGVGKSTLLKKAKNDFDLQVARSVTTRKQRFGEIDKLDYYYVSEKHFEFMRRIGIFFESNSGYGTLYSELERDTDLIALDLDMEGARAMKARWPDRTVIVGLVPPSFEALEKRLRRRATESEAVIKKRLNNAAEMLGSATDHCDYIIIANDEESTYESFKQILRTLPLHYSKALKEMVALVLAECKENTNGR